MLTERELAAMQCDADGTLVDVCDIERVTKVSDGQGGRTTTWAVVHANVPCSVAPQQIQARERPIAERVSAESAWVITVPGVALFMLVLSIALVGDGIRDVTAPENRG